MNLHRCGSVLVACLLLPLHTVASAAGPPDSAALLDAQRQSMQPLAMLDGTWRGPAKVTLPDGKEVQTTQTERVGSFLGGSIKIIEGRGYAPEGAVTFNAFGVISYSPQTGKYNFRSYALGHSGDFPLDGVWTEIGERIVEGQPPMRIFEMRLQRIGSTDWPEAGAVLPK